jgi:hypothetical protein
LPHPPASGAVWTSGRPDPPSHRLGDGGAGDLEAFSDAGLRRAALDDKLDELEAPWSDQWLAEVGNVRGEGLRGKKT